jgi:putative DNA primase/helicase
MTDGVNFEEVTAEILPPTQSEMAKPIPAIEICIAKLTPETAQNDVTSLISSIARSSRFTDVQQAAYLADARAKVKWHLSKWNAVLRAVKREKGLFGTKPWDDKLQKQRTPEGDDGEPLATMANAVTVLGAAPQFNIGALAFNEFNGKIYVKYGLPWDKRIGEACEREWNAYDELSMLRWMQTEGGLRTIIDRPVLQAVSLLAQENPFHPVRDYFDRLAWEGEQRLDRWLNYYCGCEDNEYHRAIGSRFLIGIVARIYQPGCKADCCLILEGDQGIRKSTAFKTIATPEWFTDEISDLGSKDAAMQLRGKLIVELAELDALGKAEVSRQKIYMSRTDDEFRLPYGKLVVKFPRQNSFAGSVNDSQYLRDPTGGRRFWPAKCGKSIDIGALGKDRDQLFAEAVARYHNKAAWYLDDPELVKLAKAAQDARYQEDAWEAPIAEWLNKNGRQTVTVAGMLTEALDINDKSKWNRADQMRVGICLRHLGWERKQVRIGVGREWRYVRPSLSDEGEQ